MIHPYARGIVLVLTIIYAASVMKLELILALWMGFWVVAVSARFLPVALVFHLGALLPIWTGLIIIGWFEPNEMNRATIDQIALVSLQRTGRIAIIGMSMQWFALPLIRLSALGAALRLYRLPIGVSATLLASLSAFNDLQRFLQIELDALHARGLGRGRTLWWLWEAPSLLVVVLAHAFRAAFVREETWVHRGINAELGAKIELARWNIPLSIALALAVSLATFIGVVVCRSDRWAM